VFNYWEPTHYLAHNNGLQTWEYSPKYAIRSWAYVGFHAFLSRWVSALPQMSKVGGSPGNVEGRERYYDFYSILSSRRYQYL